jgi:hypothetical protein
VGDRGPLRLGLLVAVVLGAVAGAALLASRPTPQPSELPASATSGTWEATGVVVAVDSGAGLGDVRGFTLRRPGGELVKFSLRALQNGAQFPPGHLVEHQANAYPVRVMYRAEGSEYLAIRLEDAPPP